MIKRIIPALKYIFTGQSPLPPDEIEVVQTEVKVHRLRKTFRISEREAAHIGTDNLKRIALSSLKRDIMRQIDVERLQPVEHLYGEVRYSARINILDRQQARTAKINP